MANIAGAGGRPEGRRNATPEERHHFWMLVDHENVTPEDAAEILGFQRATGRQWAKHRDTQRPSGVRSSIAHIYSTPPKPYKRLTLEQWACLEFTPEGFNRFRETYLDTREVRWQTEAAGILIAAEIEAAQSESRAPIRMLGNVFPGGGKSKMFTHDYIVWRIVRARALGENVRVQLGARTLTQSEMYVMRVRSTLTLNRKLVGDFGRFKHPTGSPLWEKGAFLVEQLPGVHHDEKEPTCFAVSQQSGFLGARAHIVVWDDLVDRSNNKTAESREQLRLWWNEEAASRVEPGGVLLLVGTRTGPMDLFKTCSKLRVDTGEADEQGHPVFRQLYRHYRFPIHNTTLCTGGKSLAAGDHQECLNYPERYDWVAIRDLMAASGGRFKLTYQQEDADVEMVLVQECWLDGTEDEDGNQYVGCFDHDRGLWEELPPFALDDYRAVITVDPSPTEFWAVEAWVFDRKNDLDYLVGMERRRMMAPALLNNKLGTLEYEGVLEDFVMQLRKLRIRVRHVIVEANAAQRFLLQYPFFKDWARSRGIIIRGHTTGGPNLADKEYGIETLGMRYMHGKVRLPFKGPVTQRLVSILTAEATSYPDGDTDDCLMSQWFGHYNRNRLVLAGDGPDYYTPDKDLSPYLAATRHGGAWT